MAQNYPLLEPPKVPGGVHSSGLPQGIWPHIRSSLRIRTAERFVSYSTTARDHPIQSNRV